jgi:stage V sporulation protein G
MTDMEISEVNVEPITSQNGLVGFSSLVINNDFKIASIAIYSCPSDPDGIRLVFPVREHMGKKYETIYPINKATYEALKVAISNSYYELMEKLR